LAIHVLNEKNFLIYLHRGGGFVIEEADPPSFIVRLLVGPSRSQLKSAYTKFGC